MYNLLVSGSDEAWTGEEFTLEASRCVNEYTDDEIRKSLGSFSSEAKSKILQLPSIFAYEDQCKKDPKFGKIVDITLRQKKVRIEYKIFESTSSLTMANLQELQFELDIGKWEMSRTHWAIKNVDLFHEL